jgi:hypothetical protein
MALVGLSAVLLFYGLMCISDSPRGDGSASAAGLFLGLLYAAAAQIFSGYISSAPTPMAVQTRRWGKMVYLTYNSLALSFCFYGLRFVDGGYGLNVLYVVRLLTRVVAVGYILMVMPYESWSMVGLVAHIMPYFVSVWLDGAPSYKDLRFVFAVYLIWNTMLLDAYRISGGHWPYKFMEGRSPATVLFFTAVVLATASSVDLQ